MGTSQVSISTKIENATWMAARPQWYLASIGLTKSVQPYCRLAIIVMQMMPKTSCHQRPGIADLFCCCIWPPAKIRKTGRLLQRAAGDTHDETVEEQVVEDG